MTWVQEAVLECMYKDSTHCYNMLPCLRQHSNNLCLNNVAATVDLMHLPNITKHLCVMQGAWLNLK